MWWHTMKLLLWIFAIASALLVVDQLLLWMERRGWIYWRRYKGDVGTASTSGMMGELHSLFSPTQHYVTEEKERRMALREDAESGSPVDREIDLDSGRVVIHPDPAPPSTTEDESRRN